MAIKRPPLKIASPYSPISRATIENWRLNAQARRHWGRGALPAPPDKTTAPLNALYDSGIPILTFTQNCLDRHPEHLDWLAASNRIIESLCTALLTLLDQEPIQCPQPVKSRQTSRSQKPTENTSDSSQPIT